MNRIAACAIAAALLGGPALAATSAPPLVIEHVTVVPMTADGAVLSDRTVVVQGGRVTSISPAAEAAIPKGARRISGRGKWLMPSLTDMHVHLENDRLMRLYLLDPSIPDGTVRTEDMFTPFLVNGILQLADMSAMSETVGQRLEVERGDVLGPHVALAAMIDGAKPIWPIGMTRVRQAVRDAKAEGYDLIKAYSQLDLETFTAIVDEARGLKMRVVGHIPGRNKGITEKFFQPGYDLVAHAEEFAQQTPEPVEAEIPRYVEMAKKNGTWLTATLSLDKRLLEETAHPESLKARPEMRFVPPAMYPVVMSHNPYVARASPAQVAYLAKVVAFNAKLAKAFADAGVPVLAGTDSPVPGVVPGFSLHEELEALADAGLTNRQVLEGATRLPAEWLGTIGDRGVVVAGRRADLLLLDADPLADVRNTRKIAAVIDGGIWLPRAELDRRLKVLDERYAALREAAARRAAH
jgi:imidazolonepropionase-like amidohydrolase